MEFYWKHHRVAETCRPLVTNASCDEHDIPPSPFFFYIIVDHFISPTTTTILAWVMILSLIGFLFLLLQNYNNNKAKQLNSLLLHKRKREFLNHVGNSYGYKDTPKGFIDDWRPLELPNLILPIQYDHSTTTTTKEEEPPREVHLDYAGAALPTRTLLAAIYKEVTTSILANPHSTGPASSRTALVIEETKKRILEHFSATPGRFAGMRHPPPSSNNASSVVDCHPGYDIVFTSGATESLRLVAERFPWSQCGHCKRRSTLVYPHNSHTSVISMRGPAMAQEAVFRCESLDDILKATRHDFDNWATSSSESIPIPNCDYCCCKGIIHHNLLVLPGECNFGGDRPDVKSIMKEVAKASKQQEEEQAHYYYWSTMLDLAKAASTSPLNLKELNPDFACLSFYKIFGEPTGLGALFVKRTCSNLLTTTTTGNRYQQHQHCSNNQYFGGGSVDVVLAKKDLSVPRSELASLTNGTIHFRGIASLLHGLNELDRMGGMSRIRQHTTSLAVELTRRLERMRHGNGRRVTILYGAWGKQQQQRTHDASLSSLPGPTVAMNMLRDDGSFVGYNEVSKLAALNHPPLQFRTGCFCNPGACQQALNLSDEDILHNYETTGHVCGDHIDLVNGQPIGAIRISFGKDSIWEDLNAFCTFIESIFVNNNNDKNLMDQKLVVSAEETTTSEPETVVVFELYVFPIKSCAAQPVTRWKMEFPCGKLAFDREFALVDTTGTAMRLQSCPKMGLVSLFVDLELRTMTVSAPGFDDLVLELDNCTQDGENNIVKVCGNKCGGRLWGDCAASEWFSSFLGVQCWLARYSNGEYLLPAEACTTPLVRNPQVAFANEQPILLIAENVVARLNKVLAEQDQRQVGTRHFRPNMVVKSSFKTWSHNAEDQWNMLIVEGKDLKLQVMGSCARCAMVDFDPTTGKKGKTLTAFAGYRRKNGQINFGIFLQGLPNGANSKEVWLEKGDTVLCNK